MQTRCLFLLVFVSGVLISSCQHAVSSPTTPILSVPQSVALSPQPPQNKVVEGARRQIGDRYDPSYVVLSYPNGDIPKGQGACTDVVIRALRNAGFDLQKTVHEDMKRHFDAYPRKWQLRRTDKNIDHRRVPNLQTFFRRKKMEQSPLKDWRAGDIVTWKLDSGLDHCGIISDRRNDRGIPFVIHNLSQCVEEDCLNTWKITGHYRAL